MRTPLVAVLGLLAVLIVPAAAQAHHVDTRSSASCTLVNDVPTVTFGITFVGFVEADKPVSGTIRVDSTSYSVPAFSFPGNTYTYRWTKAVTPGSHTLTADFTWRTKGYNNGSTSTTVTCPAPAPKHPAISIAKDGPSTAYVGDQATFYYDVKNEGDTALTYPEVSDDKCAPVVRVSGELPFSEGETWRFKCTTTITNAMGDQLVNVGTVCAWYDNQNGPDAKVCDHDEHTTKIPKPAISLVKSGAATANAGETFTYTFAAKNEGNALARLSDVVLTDDRCQSTLVRVGDADTTPATFDPGDVWNYRCTVVAPAGPAEVVNVAKVCGSYVNRDVPSKRVCDEDTHTFTVPPPTTPPTTTAPATTPPTVAPPSGDVLPESIASGTARLRGPSGCVKNAFRARVSGRSIASVAFYVDGKLVKRFTGQRSSYSIKVKPGRFGFGRHRVIARVKFVSGSGTKARQLPLTFRRCAQGAVAPRFTG